MDAEAVLENARGMNVALTVQRLERALHIYRTWINVQGVEGGYALTRDELECILEYPELPEHVEFLMATFQTQHKQRVDLITLLTTAALLCQGALEEKAKLIFTLVDLDTEDDIVQEELALVVATCCDGLRRLGIEPEPLTELDALTIAYEAFDYVDIEDGGKMTFTQFLRWCIFHPRPRALFDRVRCMLHTCTAIEKIRKVLQLQLDYPSSTAFHQYIAAHFGASNAGIEQVRVIAGPIVGKVTSSSMTVLLEVNTLATVRCFAFPFGAKQDLKIAHIFEMELQSFNPTIFTLTGLTPETSYIIRFLGVSKNDREQCIAFATTWIQTISTDKSQFNCDYSKVRAINHTLSTALPRTPFYHQVCSEITMNGYSTTVPMVTVHFGAFRITASKIHALLRLCAQENNYPLLLDVVTSILKQSYREMLSSPGLIQLLRTQSNFFYDTNEDVLFGDLPLAYDMGSEAVMTLVRIALPVWKEYLGALSEVNMSDDGNFDCMELTRGVLLLSFKEDFEKSSISRERLAPQIQLALDKFSIANNVIVMTKTPIVPAITNTALQTERTEEFRDQNHWDALEQIVSWIRASLTRKVILLSFACHYGCSSVLNVKDTTIQIPQLICGPVTGISTECDDSENHSYSSTFIVHHGIIQRQPHIGVIATDMKAESTHKRPAAIIPTLLLLEARHEARLILGPVVGFVSSRSARILIECDSDADITCILTDRIGGQSHFTTRRTKARRPTIYTMHDLIPGHVYNISLKGLINQQGGIVQTLHEESPALKLLLISDDHALNGSLITPQDNGTSSPQSYIEDIVSNFVLPSGGNQVDISLHIGCIVALAQDLCYTHFLYDNGPAEVQTAALDQVIRECLRRHWNVPANSAFLSHGAHMFFSIGLFRSLIAEEDMSLSYLRQIQAVLNEYGQVGSGRSCSSIPSERYTHRIEKNVIVLVLDTFESVLQNDATDFVMQDGLLTSAQWEAVDFWLTPHSPHQIGSTSNIHASMSNETQVIIILCDIPLVWPSEAAVSANVCDPTKSCQRGVPIFSSWSVYPKDQQKMLDKIFRKIEQNATCHVTFICRGDVANKATFQETSTSLFFDQIMIGPVSKSVIHDYAAKPVLSRSKTLCDGRYSFHYNAPIETRRQQQCCTIDVVPHSLGSTSSVQFYLQNQPGAKIIVGPVVGHVTSRSVRILIELDASVAKIACILIDISSAQRFSTEHSVEAFSPTIFKLNGLHPGTRYIVKFEGILSDGNEIPRYIQTPALVPLTIEWLVVNHNVPTSFLDKEEEGMSHWNRILARGMRSYTGLAGGNTSHANGDTLGDRQDVQNPNFNPWFHIEEFSLSEPMKSPQLLIHLGGQVDMSSAFSDEELVALIIRISGQGNSELSESLVSAIRHRLQEVYRLGWGIPPQKQMLGYSSNIMLLNEETDVYFSVSILKQLVLRQNAETVCSDAAIEKIASVLRDTAFELWQTYQNQLWVDVHERDLQYSTTSSSKLSCFATFGMCRMVFMNLSQEARQYITSYTPQTNETIAKYHGGITKEEVSNTGINLFSDPSWKTLQDGLDIEISPTTIKKNTEIYSSTASMAQNPIQHAIIVIAGDVIECGSQYPRLQADIIRLFEILFAWKLQNRKQCAVTIISSSHKAASISFEVIDKKVNEKIALTRIGSISDPRKIIQGLQKNQEKQSSIVKGYFSKRFTYQSTAGPANLSISARAIETASAGFRSYASYQYLTDFRQGYLNENIYFFPPKILPKATLGPVVGRVFLKEFANKDNPDTAQIAVLILLEINANAKVTCVVTDALCNEEFRVAKEMSRDQPIVFCIDSLLPERRYVYRFEGITDSDTRRGSFHTPMCHPEVINFVSCSSNFPDEMDETKDSLWYAIHERVRIPWCGIDAILHLGGQVPLQKAAVECFQWVQGELKHEQKKLHLATNQVNEQQIEKLRRKVRNRFQQEYRRVWNIPNIRQVLSCCSNWFLRSQADIAPFFRNYLSLHTAAARLVLEVAQNVVDDYQLALMHPIPLTTTTTSSNTLRDVVTPNISQDRDSGNACLPSNPSHPANLSTEEFQAEKTSENLEVTTFSSAAMDSDSIRAGDSEQAYLNHSSSHPSSDEMCPTRAIMFMQYGEIGIFFCDMRSVPPDDVITCNNRLQTPLNRQEHPVIGEQQWQMLESALKKKKLLAFVLCMELPLILTNAEHVDQMRQAITKDSINENEQQGSWNLYNRDYLFQHWVACRRQLEQLLQLLFRWKAKRSGRDLIILSGGMKLGIDTILRDSETRLSFRNVTTGPITANVATFEFPTYGTACPTFEDSKNDSRFTFTHTLVTNKNYLLTQVDIVTEAIHTSHERSKDHNQAPRPAQRIPDEVMHSATIEAMFVMDEKQHQLNSLHPLEKHRRFPSWWQKYIPMGRAVFWDDTIILKSQTDDDMLTLYQYVYNERSFAAALEVFYEKYHFAETARMEELRSRHLQYLDLQQNFHSVLMEVWKVIPELKRQQMAYFRDPFVYDFLLEYVDRNKVFFNKPTAAPLAAIELETFCSICRDFVFNACILRLAVRTQQEDVKHAQQLAQEQAERRAKQEVEEQKQQEAELAQEAAELEHLKHTNPEEYAKRILAKRELAKQEQEARRQEKLAQKKEQRLKEVEEERAILKEQKRLDKLAEVDPEEYTRRQQLLETRIRKLDEKKQYRAAQKARKLEKANEQ